MPLWTGENGSSVLSMDATAFPAATVTAAANRVAATLVANVFIVCLPPETSSMGLPATERARLAVVPAR